MDATGVGWPIEPQGLLATLTGYAPRSGLVHVDYDTQVRTPMASFRWLAEHLP